MTLAGALGIAALAIWIGMLALRGGFWLTRERDDRDEPDADPAIWPSVTAIVPARDEADMIGRSIASLLAQDYPGPFDIILIDDNSSDGTAAIARALPAAVPLTIIPGAPLNAGWTGKLWAVSQGVAAARGRPAPPAYVLLTDADIVHTPGNVRALVRRAVADDRVLVSLMAKLNCTSFAERALIPAFVFFFQLLYPFGKVNDPASPVAGAAGGCMLIDQAALARAGGIAAIRGALIDDCAMGAAMKRQGRIWLGLTNRARSIRPYPRFADVAAMISRSAYAQLGYSPWLLSGTLAGLALVYAAPPSLALFGHGLARIAGALGWAAMALAFQPMLRFYRRSPLWGPLLPVIAAFYAACTFLSAAQHGRGRGGMWKGRAQAIQP